MSKQLIWIGSSALLAMFVLLPVDSRAEDGFEIKGRTLSISGQSPDAGVNSVSSEGETPGEKGFSLSTLMGRADISVSADSEGQFVVGMADYQLFEDEVVNLVDESSVQESIRAGRAFNRESLAALARVDQAKAQTGQTLSLLFPSVSVRANRGYETSEPSVVVDDATGELKPSSTHIRTDITLTISQPVLNIPKFLDWGRRLIKERAVQESYHISDGDAYVSTVKAYLSLVSSRLQADVARELEAELSELLVYIEKRTGAGAASVSDMARVKARSEAIISTRLELESAHRAAGTEFVRLTNIVPGDIVLPTVADIGVSVLPESLDEAVSIALRFNPEVAALAAELAAEKMDSWAAKGRFFPRLDAEYTDTYSSHAGGSSDEQRDKRMMLVLNWNLFNGGKDLQFHRERAARHRELQYRLDDQRRRTVHSLSANYAAFSLTKERIKSGYLELESITTAAEAMSKRMLSGNQSLLDLLDVYNQRYQVRSRLVNLHILEMNTVAQLIRLTHGTPWAGEEDRESTERRLN